jgi:hypothetical protein
MSGAQLYWSIQDARGGLVSHGWRLWRRAETDLFDHRENLRYMAEFFDEQMYGEFEHIHFLSILTFPCQDTQRQLPSVPTISTLDRKRLKSSDCMHLPTGLPETACELRIRLTSGSDPTSFEDGTDLIQREGIWFLPLVHLASNTRYAGICTQLLRDGLVTPEMLSICNRLWTGLKLTRVIDRLHVLHSIAQPFFINPAAMSFKVVPIGRGILGRRCTIDGVVAQSAVKHFAQGALPYPSNP